MTAETFASVRSGLEPMTILLVEDDDVLRRVLSRVLARGGHTVLAAANVAQAKQLAEQHSPHVALIDCSLPGGHGFELAETMRARHARLPLLLMTGYPSPDNTKPVPNNDFAGIVREPFDLVDLRKAIELVLAAGN
jgi:CheY-like chemotaxis protein